MSEFTSQSFNRDELSEAEDLAESAARAVTNTLKSRFGSPEYQTKDGDVRSWVTQWDKWAQEVIMEELAEFDDSIGFVAEEGDIDTEADVYWTIDPIDGTNHFVRGNDFCTTMVALVDHDKPVVGLINDFVRGRSYSASAGNGAIGPDGENIHISNRPIEVAHFEIYTDENTDRGKELRETVELTGAYLLRSAAAGYTMLSVARGASEGFVSVRNPFSTRWDIAPGTILIHEAGGIVRNIDSDDYALSDFNFIASNQVVFPLLQGIVQRNK